MKLTHQQLAHILAALRYCQDPNINLQNMPHFQDVADGPLLPTEIDDLCEDLNCASVDVTHTGVPDKEIGNIPVMHLYFPMPEYKYEAELAFKSFNIAMAWDDLFEEFRRMDDSWPAGTPDSVRDMLEQIRTKALSILDDRGIQQLILDP